MPFRVACPNCGHRLNVKDEWDGKRIKCPTCTTAFPAERPDEEELAALAAAGKRSRVKELADEEIPESRFNLPFTFGADDRYPRLLYWGVMVYLLLDSILAVPILVSLLRDQSNQCVECMVGRASAIVMPLGIGVCLFVAYSMGALMFAGYKLVFAGVVGAGTMGAHMDGQQVELGPVVFQGVWHLLGLALGVWYFMVRRE